MTPLPKKKHTKARTGKRRGRTKLAIPNLITCKHCGEKKLNHRVCPSCGKKS